MFPSRFERSACVFAPGACLTSGGPPALPRLQGPRGPDAAAAAVWCGNRRHTADCFLAWTGRACN